MNNKKSAMFGLDARIALAIFGALSVITGAALYSAIQNAQVVSIITEVNEISKAVSAYILDTGKHITSRANDDTIEGIELMIKPSHVSNWQGPYVKYKGFSPCFKSSKFEIICLDAFKNPPYADFTKLDRRCNTGESSCGYWTYISKIQPSILKALETKIDGTKNPGDFDYNGKFIYHVGGDSKTSTDGGDGAFSLDIPYPSYLSKTAP